PAVVLPPFSRRALEVTSTPRTSSRPGVAEQDRLLRMLRPPFSTSLRSVVQSCCYAVQTHPPENPSRQASRSPHCPIPRRYGFHLRRSRSPQRGCRQRLPALGC